MDTTVNLESADRRFLPVQHSKTFNRIVKTFSLQNKKMLDLGCGYGEYLVKFGEGSLGITTTLDEVAYGEARGIRIMRGNVELLSELKLGEQFEGIWCNNLFEHLLSPHSFLVRLKTLANANTLLVLGVPVVPRISSLLKIRRFKGALAEAHINFFTKETLKLTVERAGWKVATVRPFKFQNVYIWQT